MTDRRRQRLADYPARRIALIKPSALGDIVHSLPVLSALRRRYPQAHITWIVNRNYQPLLQGHADLNEILAFDRRPWRDGWLGTTWGLNHFLRRLRQQRFDLVIDLQGLLRSGLMTGATGARRRVGLSSAREGSRWFYTDVIAGADLKSRHAVERYWRVAEEFGVGDGPPCFRIPITPAERSWVEAMLQAYPRPWMVFAVGSRWQTKRWPPQHFAALARRAQEAYSASVILIGSSGECDDSWVVADQLRGDVCNLTGQTTLLQLAAVLERADAVVANDSGPLHLAAALGRPVVAPYTCTRVAWHGPYGALEGAVETEVWCKGSYLKRCRRLECMSDLTPARLWPVLEGILATWERQAQSA